MPARHHPMQPWETALLCGLTLGILAWPLWIWAVLS